MAMADLFDRAPVRKTIICATCGKEFQKYRSQAGRALYCSMACRRLGRTFICHGCGIDVYRKLHLVAEIEEVGGSHVFCSKACASESRTRSQTCKNCGQSFSVPQSTLARKGRGAFCSRKCKDAFGLLSVPCSWPECTEHMAARVVPHPTMGRLWKVDLTKRGQYIRWPLCPHHLAIAREHLGSRPRIQMGLLKWFVDPSTNLGTRGTTAVATKLLIWAKTGGACADCREPLPFTLKGRDWNIDHRTPVFKGGLTNYHNLFPLCRPCHHIKSAAEKSEAGFTRHREHKARRWLTHPEKDALIADLRQQVDILRAEIRQLKGCDDEDQENFSR